LMLSDIVKRVEGKGLPLYIFTAEILLVGAVRIISEVELFNYDYALISYMHAIIYYFYITAFIVLVVKLTTDESIKKIMRAFSWFIPIHLLLPFLDRYVFGRTVGTQYPDANSWAQIALSFFESNPSVAHRGHQVIFLIILSLLFLYIFQKLRDGVGFSAVRATFISFLTVLFIHIGIIALSTPDLWPTYRFLYAFDRALPFYGHWCLFVHYVSFSFIFWALAFLLEGGRRTIKIIADISFPRALHFILMALLGLKMSGHALAWEMPYRVDVLSSFIALLAIALGWSFVVGINNYYDAEHDARTNPHRGIPRGEYAPASLLDFSLTCLVLGAFIVLAVGLIPFVLYIAFVSLGFAYSYPPLRVRETGLKNAVIGLGSALCFAIGYFAYAHAPSPRGDFLALFLLITAIFALGSTVNDLKDMEADKSRGIKTVFTVFGRKRGKAVASAMIFVAFMLPSLVIPAYMHIFLIPASVGALGMWFERRVLVYLSYFAEYGLIFSLL